MGREDPHFRLRIRADILERLQAAAEKTGRSVTSEINKRLEASLDADDMVEPDAVPAVERPRRQKGERRAGVPMDDTVDMLVQRIAELEHRVEKTLAQQNSDISMMMANARIAREKRDEATETKTPARSQVKKP